MAITPGTDYSAFPIPTADAATNASDIRTAIGAMANTPAAVVSNLSSITGSVTAAGDWSFTSTTRPASSGTGTPAATSLITRADALNESWQYRPQQLAPRTTTGTANSTGANVVQYAFLQLTGSAVAGNYREVTYERFPLHRVGAGPNPRFIDSKFSVLFDVYANAFDNNEVRFLFGAGAADFDLNVAGFAVVFTSATTGQLKIRDSSTTYTQAFSCFAFDFNRLNRFLVSWNAGTLTLFQKNWGDSESEPRWTQVATFTQAGLPNTMGGTLVKIVNYQVNNAVSGNKNLFVNDVSYFGISATPV